MNLTFLIGMPAAGKTWWAKKISATYNVPAYDIDELIEKEEGATITKIFDEHGESYFRNKETEMLHRLINNGQQSAIIACGGGTPIRAFNYDLMKQAGCTIYLEAELDTLIANLDLSVAKRPMLMEHGDLRGYLTEMLEQRKDIYEQADHILQVETVSIANFEKIIHSCTDRH